MKNFGVNELREKFLAFFEGKGHLRLPSFSLVPKDDPSLLLINSGMAPMKAWFTGEVEPPSKRVCTCQKCVRTGDIDNVGVTSRHGTYFEMLGNFSFGDYFKSETITWNWEFLTECLGLNPDLLCPSVYLEDDEAFQIWENEIGIPPERITRLGKEDNFWDHGSGPCGPSSEIYYDRGVENGCGSADCAPSCDCDRFVEILNNVFTQFNNDGADNYTELSQKNIDMGMGLERLACVCQGVDNLFEIDTIVSITQKISDISGVAYKTEEKSDVSIRVITDHIRSATMMICDGVLPSNEGRGYVLRRLLRRASRHGHLLGVTDAFLSDVCRTVIEVNDLAYPDLAEKADYIMRVINVEEENFGKTISAGTTKLATLIEEYQSRGAKILSGEDAFKLYDTYGFPLDLTVEILEEYGFSVDKGSFDEHMQAQRTRARKAREAMGDLAWAGVELGLDNIPTVFEDSHELRGTILAIVAQNELSSSIHEGSEGIIVLDKTPFFAEAGGQSPDRGIMWISGGGDPRFDVTNVQLQGDKYLHYGKMVKGTFNINDSIIALIDLLRRRAIERAHTATHLLHWALRTVLGEHVTQAGSLVEPDRLRFDFTHFSALSKDELDDVQRKVNFNILHGTSITESTMSMDDAKKLGAIALFGEKYGDIVRVINIGDELSTELCGGTHLSHTAEVGAFNITAEFSIASGVRRIEATTGAATLATLDETREQLGKLAAMLKATSTQDIITKLEQNMTELREARSKLEAATAKEAKGEAASLLATAQEIGGLKVIATVIKTPDADVNKLRMLQDTMRDLEPGIVSVLALVKDDKITIAAACGKEAVAKGLKAGDLVREVTKICGGSGGGKPDFAMGGGKDPSKLPEALAAVEIIVNEQLAMSNE